MNEETVSKKTLWANRIFFIIFALLLIISICLTYYRVVILKDYQVIAETSCNPKDESCFIREPEPCVDGDTECLAKPPEITYYKNISKVASEIYKCEQTEEKIGCNEELTCTNNEPNCSYTLCDSTAGESCSTSTTI